MTDCIRSRAPLRVSFCGGGTDVVPFPAMEGGCVLSATINQYAYATLIPREDSTIRAESLDLGITLERDIGALHPDGTLDLLQATLRVMAVRSGAELWMHADAPPGSGLGASSTMVVALVGLVNDWCGRSLTPHEIAALAYRIEREELRIPGGLQDQYAACFGGFNYIEFHADHVVVNPLRLRPAVLNELTYGQLLFFTGQTRDSGRIIERQTAQVVSRGHGTVEALRELKRLTIELKRVLLLGDVPSFGALLHEAWQAKRQLAPGVTTDRIDMLYGLARERGAWGGKILGAGGGGYLLVLAPFRQRQRIIAALESHGAKHVPFAFEWDGVVTWRATTG
jgi:D-glycero-alpha-D-manno-heptose-7-phosphate kinase